MARDIAEIKKVLNRQNQEFEMTDLLVKATRNSFCSLDQVTQSLHNKYYLITRWFNDYAKSFPIKIEPLDHIHQGFLNEVPNKKMKKKMKKKNKSENRCLKGGFLSMHNGVFPLWILSNIKLFLLFFFLNS